LRIVSDPTFDDPGPHGYLTKTAGPAVTEDQLGPVDLVLISHDNHPITWTTAAAPWPSPPRWC
jgi:L-ascorbate metabolism protein UlaG (beta-lactamase superfamily)